MLFKEQATCFGTSLVVAILGVSLLGCQKAERKISMTREEEIPNSSLERRVSKYATFTLHADLSPLSENEKKILGLLIDAADIMNEIFWKQSYGNRDELLGHVKDPVARKLIEINYGPWDRLDNNQPFIEGVGPKPLGANFYPQDMTKEEFEAAPLEDKRSPYTLLRRNSEGKLITIPYNKAYEQEHKRAANLLRQAAQLSQDIEFKNYLNQRAEALLTNNYQPSDLAWMDMKNNTLDIVIGPIENYEDKLFGYKTAHEAYVLIKDKAWSKKLEHYIQFLPELQKALPVPEKYKKEQPGTDAQLNAYDAVYYAGDCNAGSKTIAINLPNDEEVQLQKGSRRLQLKNAMRAKFEKILLPISQILIAPEQRKHIHFDAFFANTMFHEVAHGLGIKNTVNNKGKVKDALKELHAPLEECKADVLGLYMITQLIEKGHMKEHALEDYYVTFVASIFRSVRFGAASAHAKANMLCFNFLVQEKAILQENKKEYYIIDFPLMKKAIEKLAQKILQLQGDGDYNTLATWLETEGIIKSELQKNIDKLVEANIPVDIVFEQGKKVLGI
ncbi:MAG: Zn-dependent hydrolase [Bacteroidia bacterium]|nr:Zn-dependent hydrolase [Bacteroidia bacterium]MDW8158945.1 Zn-dependent hydrolase [Bacteroidia bacterium]